jgi:glycosyltransferase involved in cell wall biosynthesis
LRHLALVIPTIDRIGGAERQVLLLAKGLAQRGWRVSLIALSGTGSKFAAELSSAGIAYHSLQMRRGLADPRGWIRFNRWLRHHNPDILHAHLPHAVWLARWSRLFAPACAVVDTIHTSATGTWGRKLGYRFSDRLSDTVTAVSDSVADAYTSAHMVSSHHLAVLPNGVDTETWQPDPSARDTVDRELGLTDEFLWLAAGRLERVKDYPTLLRAFGSISAPARLVIAGAGPDEAALRLLARDLGVESRVQFLGFVPDVRRWLQAADGFVLSSLWEGLPMSILEASACAVPSVAVDVPGTHETILHGQTGLLAEPGSVDALAVAMTRMMNFAPQSRQLLGQRARQFVVDRFSLNSVLDRWETLYAELLDRASVSAVSTSPRQA